MEHPLIARPAAARAAGFSEIELWWPFTTPSPASEDLDELLHATAEAGVRLTGLAVYPGDADERGLLSLPGREREFREAFDAAVDVGRRFGVANLTCLYGRAPAAQRALHEEVAVENLRYAAAAAAEIGAQVLLEPVSGVADYPLRTAAEVVHVLERVHDAGVTGRLRMLADLFHLTTNGDDLTAVIRDHAAWIGHVHLADAPGRHEPGTGALELERVLGELAAAGYSGRVALEYVPSTDDTVESLRWLPLEQRSGAEAASDR